MKFRLPLFLVLTFSTPFYFSSSGLAETPPVPTIENQSCSFSVNGQAYIGKSSTQVFPATKEFSVLCEPIGEEAKLVQFVFKDETSARVGQKFKIVHDLATKAEGPNEVSVTYESDYVTKDSSAGSISVLKDKVTSSVEFEDVLLENSSKESVRVSGKILF